MLVVAIVLVTMLVSTTTAPPAVINRDEDERARALVPGYFESRPIQRHAWEIVSRLGVPQKWKCAPSPM
jgi:hypothetical protein